MSAYICGSEAISLLVDGFMNYGTSFKSDGYKPTIQIIYDIGTIRSELGQELLNKNYDSVNYHNENCEPHTFRYIENEQRGKDYKYSTANLYDVINEYEIAVCMPHKYFESDLHFSMLRLKNDMLKRYIVRDMAQQEVQ